MKLLKHSELSCFFRRRNKFFVHSQCSRCTGNRSMKIPGCATKNPATHYAAFQKALNPSKTQRLSGEEMQVCNTFDHRLPSQLRCLAFCAVHFYRPCTEWVGCIQLEVLHT